MPQLDTPVGPDDHAFGPDDAPLTLLQYGDYQCPGCLVAVRVVDKLMRRYDGRLRFVFRHFLMEAHHPLAESAAELVEFAGTEGKFWPMHHGLYAHQDSLSAEKFEELAVKLGLDAAGATAAMREQRFAARIRAQMESGLRSGVETTPTFFVNGEKYSGANSYEGLAAAIEEADLKVGETRG